MKIRAFISYSHNDKELYKSLKTGIEEHLKIIEEIEWNVWSDENIKVGQDWQSSIQNAVKECQLAILLISPNFFNSEYIREQELKEFLEKVENNDKFILFPILLVNHKFQKINDIAKFQIFVPNGEDYGFPNIKQLSYDHLFYDPTKKAYLNEYHMALVDIVESTIAELFNSKENVELNKILKTVNLYNQSVILNEKKQLINKLLAEHNSVLVNRFIEKLICPFINTWIKNIVDPEPIIFTTLFSELVLRKCLNNKYKKFNEILFSVESHLNNIYPDKYHSRIKCIRSNFELIVKQWGDTSFELVENFEIENNELLIGVQILTISILLSSFKKYTFELLPIDNQSDFFDPNTELSDPIDCNLIFNSIIEIETNAYNVSEFILLNLIRFHLENKIEQICELYNARNINFPIQTFKYKLLRKPENWGVQQFTTDTIKVINLLMGKELYGGQSQDVWFRELYQNAIDACTSRENIDKAYLAPKIEISYDQNLRKFTIKDNGIGMSVNHINRYFSKVGRSFWRSEELIKLTDKGKINKLSIGKFGIGFLSVFQIAESIVIKTRYSAEDNGTLLEIRSINEPYFLENLFSCEVGTEISVYLKTPYEIDLKRIISKFIAYYPERIIVKGIDYVSSNPTKLLDSLIASQNNDRQVNWYKVSKEIPLLNANLHLALPIIEKSDDKIIKSNKFIISNGGIIISEIDRQWLGKKRENGGYYEDQDTGIKWLIGILDFEQGLAPLTASRNEITLDENSAKNILNIIREEICVIMEKHAKIKFEKSTNNVQTTNEIIYSFENSIEAKRYYRSSKEEDRKSWSGYENIYDNTLKNILVNFGFLEYYCNSEDSKKESLPIKRLLADNRIIITDKDQFKSPLFKLYYSQNSGSKIIILNSSRTRYLFRQLNSNWKFIFRNLDIWNDININEIKNTALYYFLPAEFAIVNKDYFLDNNIFITVLPRKRASAIHVHQKRSEVDIPARILVNKDHLLTIEIEKLIAAKSIDLDKLNDLCYFLYMTLDEKSEGRKKTHYAKFTNEIISLCKLKQNISIKLND